MLAYVQPLSELQVEAARFMRDGTLRLFHVVTDHDLRDASVDLLRAQEYRLDNRSPFIVLDQSYSEGDPGWERRVRAAREQHDRRREEMHQIGEALTPLPEAPTSRGLVAFAEQLGQLLLVRPEETEGLVVLLAPSTVEHAKQWQREISTLLTLDGLRAVRWIVVEAEPGNLDALTVRDGTRALRIRCSASGESPKAIVAEALNENLLRWAGPIGARPKGVTPPRRVDDPPLAELDPSVVERLAVQRNMLQASVAQDEGRATDAVRHQRQARDIATKAGLLEEGVAMELVLGSYLIAAGSPEKAGESYVRAAQMADELGLFDKVATAHVALGAVRLLGNDRPGALVAYAEASTAAERAENVMLTLEACRLTGDVANDLSMDAQALAFWSKAVKLGEQMPAIAPHTSAGLAALNLALLCKARRQPKQGALFLEKAHRLTGIDVALLEEEARSQLARRQPPPQVDPTSVAIDASAGEVDAENVEAVEAPAPPKPGEVAAAGPSRWPSPTPSPAEPPRPPAEPRFVPLEELARPPANAPTIDATITLSLADLAGVSATPKVDDGTHRLSRSDIEALHWGSARASQPVERPAEAGPLALETTHRWSKDEQRAIREATEAIAIAEVTTLLSPEELRALRGDTDLPDARARVDVERTVRLDAATLRMLREGSMTQTPAVTEEAKGGTRWLSANDIAKLRRRTSRDRDDESIGAPAPSMTAVRTGETQRVAAADLAKLRRSRTTEEGTEIVSAADLGELRPSYAVRSPTPAETKPATPVQTGRTERVSGTTLQQLRNIASASTPSTEPILDDTSSSPKDDGPVLGPAIQQPGASARAEGPQPRESPRQPQAERTQRISARELRALRKRPDEDGE